MMRKLITILVLSLLLGCNSSTKKVKDADSGAMIAVIDKNERDDSKSGDYSTLLIDYKCAMSAAEIAKVLKVPESNVTMNPRESNTMCWANLSGFNSTSTELSWGSEPPNGNGNKKAIARHLKNKKNNEAVMGNDIVLAETGDCYLFYQPSHGFMLILHEDYEQAFVLRYGFKENGRTKEQHEELRHKMTDLANYLLKKHRK